MKRFQNNSEDNCNINKQKYHEGNKIGIRNIHFNMKNLSFTFFRSKINKREAYKQKASGNCNKQQISQTNVNHNSPISAKYNDKYQNPIANPNSNNNTISFQKSSDNVTPPAINPPKSTWAISVQMEERILKLDFVNLKLLTKTKLAEKLKKINVKQAGFIRFTKKSLITMLAAWIVVVSSGLLYMFGPWVKEAEAAWFDDNWRLKWL